MRWKTLSLSLLLASACDSAQTNPVDAGTPPPDAGPTFRPECENINPVHCMLPWPSSFYLAEDSTTATGYRISIPVEAMPRNQRNRAVDPEQFSRFDGFSASPTIMTSYPGVVDESGLHGETEIAETLEATSSTQLLDAETGERIPHFAEIDAWEQTDPARAPLYIRPAVRLREGHRYVVAVRGLRYADGSAIEPSDYFRALRDETPLADSDVESRRAHFEEVFAVLETAGLERAQLIEAWDFVTASGENVWGDLVAIRDDAVGRSVDGDFGRMGERGLGCTVVSVREGADAESNVYRRIEGTMTVPLYLNSREPSPPDEARIHRDASGAPEANGTVEVPFLAIIPASVAERVRAGGAPGRLEVYGHGLFGSRTEIDSGWHREHQNDLDLVTVAVDWWGMSFDDLARVTLSLQEFSSFDATPERLHQAVINFLGAARSFRGVCSELPELQIALEGGATAPSIDTSAAYYYGNSQGGIMGGVVAGVAVDIERFVLGVGGMSYPLMIKRSTNWQTYNAIMTNGYPDALVRDLLLSMSASLWDLAEPSTYSAHLVSDPLPGTPLKRVLMQIGIGDAQVPNLSAELQARTVGIPYLLPSPTTPFGLEGLEGPLDSALVVYRIPGAEPALPGTRSPDGDTPAHEGVRRSASAREQIDAFWRPEGRVEHFCDGVCDPD
jgi:hypothetical protein